MNTQEHLAKIRAKCVDLLATAKLRAPGKWEAFQRNSEIGTNYFNITFTDRDSYSLHGYCGETNAAFIASCAGPAEAGWAATIAAIDGLEMLSKWKFPGWDGDCGIILRIENEIDNIIAAWPEDLLK